ncbi:MAG: zinc metallopeptidase [Bacilli bacterium]
MNDILFLIIILIIPVCAQLYINSSYSKYSKIKNDSNKTGYDIAREILDKNGLKDILILETKGMLTDHYDPRRKTIKLSSSVYKSDTVASIAVASHEVGHALQDKDNYLFFKIRGTLVPIVNFTSNIAYFVILIGFISSITNLVWIGIILVSIGVLFELITLPVEFNASSRALKEMKNIKDTTTSDINGSTIMLKAAALTYVAGLLTSILQLLRLIFMADNND